VNFIHASDFHLGYMQYNLPERFKDFAKTFEQVIRYAYEKDVEFILIAGDLFHKRNINAPTYLQAFKVLTRLKKQREEKGKPPIQVIAIEGNHDLAYQRDGQSWLEILNAQGLLKLIKIKEGEEVELMGDFVNINGIRIFGMRYLGSSTLSAIPRIAQEIKIINRRDKPKYTILMMHFGMEGQLKHEIGGEISYSALLPLREAVDYLALGHYHMAYSYDNWVYNSGCLETYSLDEHGFAKGFYHVTDKGANLIQVKTRPIKRLSLDISRIQTPEELYTVIKSNLAAENISSGLSPIIDLTLWGNLNFPKTDISIGRIKKIIQEKFNSLWVEVRIHKTNDAFTLAEGDIRGLSREQIEYKVLSERVKLDGRFKNQLELITYTMIEVKKMAISGAKDTDILEAMRKTFNQLEDRVPPRQRTLPFAYNEIGGDG
jgi:DNA repair exonuclease SbcCD nuclease subunit